MHFTTGASKNTWQPVMSADTTNPHYWLNWKLLLCSVWVVGCVAVSSVLIRRYEGRCARREGRTDDVGTLYIDELWRPCLEVIHPGWLLAFRVVSFFVLLALLILNVVVDGGSIFYYYTQWTFVLVTIYFGLGSLISANGCLQYLGMMGGHNDNRVMSDAERATYISPTNGNANEQGTMKSSVSVNTQNIRKITGFWGYVFQIIYQTNAGAVMLTDCVFWIIIFPYLAVKDYDLNLILISMHSVNAVFLLGDTALNNLRFPWFRISYFLLWTSGFVVFQWIIHACISIWWPYPFLDLSSPKAPLWFWQSVTMKFFLCALKYNELSQIGYLVVALMHIPCYAIFPLVLKMKHCVISRYFPQYLSAN